MPKGEAPGPSSDEAHRDDAVEKSASREPDHFYEFIGKAVVWGMAVGAIILAIKDLSTPLPKQAATTTTPDKPAPLIHAKKPPSKLPPLVQRDYDSVIQVNYGDAQGSGVKVSASKVLSAGHLVMPEGQGHPSPVICGQQAGTSNVHSTTPYDNQIINYFGRYNGPNSSGFPDYSLLSIDADDTFASLPSASIARSAPPIGSVVYFINYESNDTGQVYSYPNQAVAQNYEGGHSDHAAEYAGIVIGQSDGLMVVATGLQGYGPTDGRQVNSHGGSSGGGVFEGSGPLVGLSDDSSNEVQPAGSIAAQYGVVLPLNSRHGVGVTYVQPITPAILQNAEAQMTGQTAC